MTAMLRRLRIPKMQKPTLAGHEHEQSRSLSASASTKFTSVVPGDITRIIDWRKFMNPKVILQGKHHCWAIAAAECTGALHYMVTGEQLILSPQYILDCVTWQKETGGKVADAFEHMQRYGIALEADWPYQQRPLNKNGRRIKIGGYRFIHGEHEIQSVLSDQPLVSWVAVHPSMNMGNYRGGLLRYERGFGQYCFVCDPKGDPMEVQDLCTTCGYGCGWHTTVLTGYGIDFSNHEVFWEGKNSAGPQWGEGGYFRTLKNAISGDPNSELGVLGIQDEAIFPLPAKDW